MANTSIVPGSVSAIAQRDGMSLAETFIGCDAIILFDSSGSMDAKDSRDGMSRYDVALKELAMLQAAMPGKIAVIAFSTTTVFCPGGQPPFLAAGTNLTKALKFAKVADVPDMRFVVISDGEPDDGKAAMVQARKYQARIDVVYVGPEASPRGRKFLTELAAASGGDLVTADRVTALAEKTQQMLLAE